MNRRDAIARVGLLVGGTVVGANAFLTGCAPKRTEEGVAGLNFSTENLGFLDEVGETILPETQASPGAKAAKIGDFMKAIVSDCYEETDQKIFMDGIAKLNQVADEKFGDDFVSLSAEDKIKLLVELDNEAKEHQKNKKKDDPQHYFTMMKQLTLWGYFTSEVGSTKALRYNPVPGRYEGCIDYKKGDKAWSAT
jgi:hypothetical protein